MNLLVRGAGDLPVLQKSFFRNLVALIVAGVVLVREGKGFLPSNRKNWPLLLARACFGTIGILCNFYAVDHLLLSDASMLNKMSPFFALIASAILLKEKFSAVQGVTLVGAFAGALLIIKPSFNNLDLLPAAVGLTGGLAAGIAYTLVRLLGKRGERSSYIVFVFSTISCLVALPKLLFDFTPMTMRQVFSLLAAGLFAAGGQFCITAAYRCAPAREISVYDYSQVIFAALLGFLVFGDIPDRYSVLGYIIICGMAVLSFWYNTQHNPAEPM